MHSKSLYTILIVALILGALPVAGAAQPAAAEVAAPSAPTAVAVPQAQPVQSGRQMPPWVRELSAEELARLDAQTSDLAVETGRTLPQALNALTGSGQKTMLVVELEQPPLAAYAAQQRDSGKAAVAASTLQSYLASLESAQAAVQRQLEALGVQVVSNYTTVYNGFLAYVPQDQVDAIRRIPGVVGVHRAPEHVPALGASVPLIGAPDVWEKLDYDGTGVVIAIIDTGIDYTHAVFGGSGNPADFANNNPNIIERGSFPTAKVVAGYDFAGTLYNAGCSDVDQAAGKCSRIPTPDRDPLDENGHGTHVASIAAGQAAGQVSSGVAPGAKLMALKVFGREGSTNLVMNALDIATFNYLFNGWPQVINMSLGSSYGPGDDMADPDIIATNNAVAAGIVVAASAGNSGDLYYSTGSPGTASKAIGVAGSTTGWVTGPTVDVVGSTAVTLTNIIYMPPAFSDDGQYLVPLTATLAFAGNYSSSTLCAGSTATPADAFQGKIALIERGGCTFVEKVRTAKALGAVGALIFNSVAGGNTYIVMADDGNDNFIPAGFLARQDGLNLTTADGQMVVVSAVNVVRTVRDRYTPPDSVYPASSRGPRGTDSMLKPEVGAPGYNVFAAAMGTGVEGVSYSGTSMAAPHIAGVAALMVQAHPGWTPQEIKAAMMNTAIDYVDGTPIPRQGAGRVDAYRAVSTPVYAVGDADFVSISGYFATNHDTHVIARPVTVHNTDTITHTYAVSWERQGASLPGLDVALSADRVVVGPGATTSITATFTFTMTELPAVVGELEEVYGYVVLTPPPLYRLYLPLVLRGGTPAATVAHRPQGLIGPEDTLRIPFYFVPRPYNELEITAQTVINDLDDEWATFAITHTGPITSSLWVYPLLVSDPKEAATAGDIKAIGVDYAGTHPTLGPIVAFAVSAWAPWHLPHFYFAEFDIYIDNDEDGQADFVIYNAPVSGTNAFVPRIVNLRTGAATNSPFAIYVDYNSGYMELYVRAAQLGLGATNTTFNFQVYGWDYWGNRDVTAPGRFDYARYPFAWDADTLEPGPAAPNAVIDVWVNDAEGYAYSQPEGVMIVDYTGNPANGGETYLFDVTVNLSLDLTVLHTNDFHARVDEYNVNGARCKPADAAAGNCIAGAPRLATVVQEIRNSKPNVLLLDAGDQFQGTLFYTLFKGDVLTETMNYLGYDAMTLGNHEFDNGPTVLADFIAGADFPVVSANIDVTNEPALKDKIQPYVVLKRGGHRIGIVGVITPDAPNISSPGPNVVFNDPVTSLQAAVNALRAQGVNKIIALTHLGYAEDVALATQVTGVDIIIGGHSHTFLYNPATPQTFSPPNLGPLTPAGAYPTVVGGAVAANGAAEPVLVVAAYQWGTFLGNLDVTFNADGVLTAWGGNPIYISREVAKDPTLDEQLEPYREAVAALIATPVGETTVDLPINVGGRRICRLGECLMGNLVADAMLWKANEFFPGANYQIAFQNGGGLRAPILAGQVTLGDVLETLPFGNAIATFELKGEYVKSALENGARLYPAENGGFAQVSGMRYVIDPNQPAWSRITSVEVWNGTDWEPLDPNAMYKVVTNDFMRRGGDGYTMFRDYAVDPYDFGPLLDEALADYFRANSPVTPVIEGRITGVPVP